MHDGDIDTSIRILKRLVQQWQVPIVTQVAHERGNSRAPFSVLISCLLSLRTKDETTAAASQRLFALARTPQAMLRLGAATIARTIYPVGFYRNKATQIIELCRVLIDRYGGQVPDEIDELLKFKGVGRKTANLVVTLGYGKPGICVDTHVHRISNRWGYIHTKNPQESEFALRAKLPRRHWLIYNDLLVSFGQNLCKPISPLCSRCPLSPYCDRVGVERWR